MEFGYRGRQYAIDLNDEHAEEFDSLLSRYVAAARDITPPAAHHRPGGSDRVGAEVRRKPRRFGSDPGTMT